MVVLSEAQPDQETNSLVDNESLSREVREPKRSKKVSRKRQSRRKQCKNGKKGKKCRRNQKASRRSKNNKRPGRKSTRKSCARQSGPDDSTCMANIGTAMDYQGTQIRNFGRQKAKIEKFEKLMKNKGGKKDDFSNSTTYMTSACSSSSRFKCFLSLVTIKYFISSNASAVSTITLLQNCSSSINEGCQVPSVNSTMLDSCKTSFDAVETKNKECYTLITAASPVRF